MSRKTRLRQLQMFDQAPTSLSQQLVMIDDERLWRRITDIEESGGGYQRGTVVVRGVVYTVERDAVGDRIWRPVEGATPDQTLVQVLW